MSLWCIWWLCIKIVVATASNSMLVNQKGICLLVLIKLKEVFAVYFNKFNTKYDRNASANRAISFSLVSFQDKKLKGKKIFFIASS